MNQLNQTFHRLLMVPILLIVTLVASFHAAGLPTCQAQDAQRVNVARLTPEVRNAITKGLAYLAKDGVQNADGSWGDGRNSVAETSLALMAFMLKGNVPGRGRYGRLMNNGIAYLLNTGKKQRGFIGTNTNHAGMYEHGLAVLALSEAWGQSKNPQIKISLRKAVDIILRAQARQDTANNGGWRYNTEPGDADLSMTVMQLVALNSAREAGIAVPGSTIDRATKYVLRCQDKPVADLSTCPKVANPVSLAPQQA